MRYRALLVVILVAAASLSFASWGGRAQGPQRKTWEYKVVVEQYGAQPASLGEQQMNKLGAEGWELVDTRVVPFQLQQGGSTQYRTDYHFKRVR
jgi:hypothetical protein